MWPAGHCRPVARVVLLMLLTGAVWGSGCRNRHIRDAGRRDAGRRDAGVPLSKAFASNQAFAVVIPQLDPVPGVGAPRAERCGSCHAAIYAEWKRSTHAAALRDLQYQAELHKKSSPRWLCLNCHIPVQNQRREVVLGLRGGDIMRPVTRTNPRFDRKMMAEAITCAACHVRRGKGGRSVVLGVRGNPNAPHPVRRAPRQLRESCYRCHAPLGKRITPTLVCWFDTREELARGPYHGKKGCVECHMPATKRRLAKHFTTFPERQSRRHHWVGGGVPKTFSGYDTLLSRGYRPALDVKLASWRVEPVSGRVDVVVELTNARAGHWLPTADPERHLLVEARTLDGHGKTLGRTTYRVGQIWKWAPRAVKLSDNRLKPKERRTWKGTVKARAGSRPVRLLVTVLHVRLTTQNARTMRTERVSARWVPGVAKKIRRLEQHYPMATYVYRERVDLGSGHRQVASPKRLIALSKAERSLPLEARAY